MIRPSESDTFQRLASHLSQYSSGSPQMTYRSMDLAPRFLACKESVSDLAVNMVELNNEAQLARNSFNRTSCELRVASTSLRKSLVKQKHTRLCHGLFGYSFD